MAVGLYRYNGRIVLFVHIPKTGGTTIEMALRQAGAAEALRCSQTQGYLAAPAQHMQAGAYTCVVPGNFYDYGFAVVRNPYTRIASEYHWRCEVSGKKKPFDAWAGRHLADISNQPYRLDNHLRPQVDFLCETIETFRYEDGLWGPISSAFHHLQLPAMPQRLPHAKASRQRTLSVSEGTLALIRSHYAEDFRHLGYDPEIVPDCFSIAGVGRSGATVA